MMKKLIFAFATAVTMFLGGQAYTAHADTLNNSERFQTVHQTKPKTQHPQNSGTKSDDAKRKELPISDAPAMFVDLSKPQSSKSSSSDNMVANLSPQVYLTSNKHFKVPETDTIDGDGEMTDPSKGYAMNHYTGDNVNGDAQANDHAQPRQGKQF